MNRFVVYYLRRYKDIPRAEEYVCRQLAWAQQGSMIVFTATQLVQALRDAAGAQEQWDEIILMTDDLVGPVRLDCLETVLVAMGDTENDAWGLACGLPPEAEIPSMGQARLLAGRTFIALRRRLFTDATFISMLSTCGEDPMEAVAAWIDGSGRNYGSWIAGGTAGLGPCDPLRTIPYTAVTRYGVPFIDIRCFRLPHDRLIEASMGEETSRMFRLLSTSAPEEIDWLWERLLTEPMDYNLIENLGLMACMETGENGAPSCPPEKACLLMHLYYQELGREALQYASHMPETADIYITTSSLEKKRFFEELFGVLPNRVEVRTVENRGRDMAGLLVGLRDVTSRYELCCFYHDKKSPANGMESVGRSFAYMISESMLASRGYIKRILQKFHEEPRLGLLCPMVPHHGDYYLVGTHFWDHNYPYVLELLDKLEITVPVNEDSCVPVAWGNVFWFRTRALQPLLRYPWKHEDFPEEPYPIDGSIAHAIERAHCIVAQSQGYYTSLAAPPHLVSQQMLNFFQYWKDYANEMVRSEIVGPHREVVQYCGKCLNCAEVRTKQKISRWIQRMKKQ